MKRVFLLLLIITISISLSAERYYWSSSSISASKNSSMTVVVEATSSILNCGVSSTFDSSKSDWGLTDVTKKEFEITSETTSQEWSYKGSISELYVWWQIYSTSNSYKVDLSLSPLKDKSTGSVYLQYSAIISSLNPSGQYEKEDDSTFSNISSRTLSKKLYTYTGSSTSNIESGHKKLSFQTTDAKGNVADSFEATLTIQVSTV